MSTATTTAVTADGSSDPAAIPTAAQTPSADTFVPPADKAALDALLEAARAEGATPFADYETLKAAAATAETSAARVAELEAAVKDSKVSAALREAAIVGKAVNVDQVLALLPKDSATVGDDGVVTGAAEAVAAFLTANQHLVAKDPAAKIEPLRGAAKVDAAPTILSQDQMRAITPKQLAADPNLKAQYVRSHQHWIAQGKA